ncbi:MAG: chloride channel protein [Acidobacteriota bacterium]
MHTEESLSSKIPLTPDRPLGFLSFGLLAVLIGVIAGLGAVVFRGLISIFHNLLFLGEWSTHYDANLHTPPSPWGVFVILVPIIGAAGVAFLVKTFAPEAKGHGVPEVIDAIYYNKGAIRPIVALIKSIASALSIGSGGSIGREGPIIQIGASFGSTLGQLLRIPPWQTITMIAAGAGGGIAATFNTPVGGVLFAIEIVLHELSSRTLVPVAISTATATYVGRFFFGAHPSFVIPAFQANDFHLESPLVFLTYALLGILTGIVSAVFIRSIYGFEDFFTEKIKGGYYVQHMLGMSIVGVTMYLLLQESGHYYVQGVGYATIQDVLSGKHFAFVFLLLLLGLKLLATSLTLGSGASGGIFSPALYMGAALGGAYGLGLNGLSPAFPVSAPACAVAGMAGVVGGATGAAMAAIVMIFEMTLDYNVIIPMTITVAISFGVRKLLSSESIYTLKLVRRGRDVPEALQANLHYLQRARQVMDSEFGIADAATRLPEARDTLFSRSDAANFVVRDGERIAGVLTKDKLFKALTSPGEGITLGEIADQNYLTVSADTRLFTVIARMRTQGTLLALVADEGRRGTVDSVKGFITNERLVSSMVQDTELFSD